MSSLICLEASFVEIGVHIKTIQANSANSSNLLSINRIGLYMWNVKQDYALQKEKDCRQLSYGLPEAKRENF